MKRLTPNLLVTDIAASLAFWHGQLGFEIQATVPVDPAGPVDGPVGFAMLKQGEVEIMLQDLESVRNDAPQVLGSGEVSMAGVNLFLEVEGPLDPWLPKLEDCEVLVERRMTFYGADEIGVRTPDGATLILASFGAGAEQAPESN
jgi:catechol 2,3-dioxygenase-like lactoylglutathione lyase family enzyme